MAMALKTVLTPTPSQVTILVIQALVGEEDGVMGDGDAASGLEEAMEEALEEAMEEVMEEDLALMEENEWH
jgi:hypothetical protein